MAKWAQAKKTAVRTRDSVTLPMAQDLCDEHARLQLVLRRAREADEQTNDDDTAPAVAQRILELEDLIQASEWTFVFEGMGRQAYRRLVAEHAPTDEQMAVAKDNGVVVQWNVDTFPPALMAASSVSVTLQSGEKVDGVDFDEIWADWSNGQITQIWNACLAANAGVADSPKSAAASALMAGSRKS